MEFRQLTRDEIPLFFQLNRKEVVEHIYFYESGDLILKEDFCDIPDWSDTNKQEFVKSITSLFDRGGWVFGAFDNQTLVGMATLDSVWLGQNTDQLNLNGLWVSFGYRGQGVATKLVNLIIDRALVLEAKGLYVSATPSENTVKFYRNRGFELADNLDMRLFEKEPEDIHMVLDLVK